MTRPLSLPFDRDGWFFVLVFASVACLLSWLGTFWGLCGWGLTAWCIYFFRDPERVSHTDATLVSSPADGRIVSIARHVAPPAGLDTVRGEWTRISIFMNVFDVHVNRFPVAGTVHQIVYIPGAFFNATLDKSSEQNERQALLLRTPTGAEVICVQIAGLIARRIRCDTAQGAEAHMGQRYGMIRFGSRVDVYLAPEVAVQVLVGQRTVAGETILAKFQNTQDAIHRE